MEPATIAATPTTTPTSSGPRAPLFAGMPPARGRVAPPPLLDWSSASNFKGSECLGSFERECGGHHREPDAGSRTAAHRGWHGRLRAARRCQHRRKDGRPASGSTSPTTSTSSSGARRARTAPTTSPRAARSRSKGASTGASGRPKTAAANGRRSRSSPTRSSSSAPATAPAAVEAATATAVASRPPQSDVPADTSDFEGAPAGGGGGSEDDIPF